MIYYLGVINNIHVKVVARSSSHVLKARVEKWENTYKRGTLCRYFKKYSAVNYFQVKLI